MKATSMPIEERLKNEVCMAQYSGLLRTLMTDKELLEAAQLTDARKAEWVNDSVFGWKLVPKTETDTVS